MISIFFNNLSLGAVIALISVRVETLGYGESGLWNSMFFLGISMGAVTSGIIVQLLSFEHAMLASMVYCLLGIAADSKALLCILAGLQDKMALQLAQSLGRCGSSALWVSSVASSRVRSLSSLPDLEFVKVEQRGTDGRVGLVTLNRPKALNALCSPLIADLMVAMRHFDADPKWLKAKQAGKIVGVLAFDLSSAFDTVNSNQLLPKLLRAGITGSALDWFGSYLDWVE
eukprot:snap_masked-scaffold77_size404793-processed-gene-0.0 protein:Tk04767 transcript:snap_masked-scaffold77_size404793-processed-gene-0.0-mRNA-1 annotation:"mitochondrial enoyl coenzyme a hydratase short chain 1"